MQPSSYGCTRGTCSTLEAHDNSIASSCTSGKWVFDKFLHVLSPNVCFSQRLPKQRVSGQEESAVRHDGLEDSVSKSTVIFCLLLSLVCPSDCFNTIMVELLTLMSFSCPTGYTGATERVRLWSFRLQGTTNFGQSERASLTFSFSQSCYSPRGCVRSYWDLNRRRLFKIVCMRFSNKILPPPSAYHQKPFPLFCFSFVVSRSPSVHFAALLIWYVSRAFHQWRFPALSIGYIFPSFSSAMFSRPFPHLNYFVT